MQTLNDLTILYLVLILVFSGILMSQSTRLLVNAERALERKELTGYQLITCRAVIMIEFFYRVRYAVLLAASIVTVWVGFFDGFRIQYSWYFLAVVWVLAISACSVLHTFVDHCADGRCWSCGEKGKHTEEGHENDN